MEKSRNAHRILVGKPEGRTSRFEDNIKMDLRKVGYVPEDWIVLTEDRDEWRAYVEVINETLDSLKAN